MKPEHMIRLGFSVAAALLAARIGFGINYVQYHNLVVHQGSKLPSPTEWVCAAVPWVFLVPLAVLVAGAVFRKRPLVIETAIGFGWLFAVTWPATCIWVWQVPTILL
jgi:hypothetical protein